MNLAALPTQPSISLTLLSADPHPPLWLHPPINLLSSTGFLPQAPTYATPASSPQPSVQSPDQPMNAPTPASGPLNAGTPIDMTGEVDNDATLIDFADETWAVILSQRLRNSNSLVDHRPALASGLLIKRGGPHDDDPPVCMSLNLLHAQVPYESLLREVLSMYRGLGVLARFKSVVDPLRSVLPWHIATAIKVQEGLALLM